MEKEDKKQQAEAEATAAALKRLESVDKRIHYAAGQWHTEGFSSASKWDVQEHLLRQELALEQQELALQRAQKSRRNAIVAALLAACLAGVIYAWWSAGAPEREARARVEAAAEEDRQLRRTALASCRVLILVVASYGDAETPPTIPGSRHDDRLIFDWPHGSFYFKNGFGAKVPQSATCAYDVPSGRVVGLAVSGKVLMSPDAPK